MNGGNMDEEEKKREEEKARHEKTKRTLKITGLVLLICGLVLDIIFFVDFISSMYGRSGIPRLFVCGMIGLPLTAIGFSLLMTGSRREINRYIKNESVPIVNETAQELKPAIRAVAEAVKETDGKGEANNAETTVCPHCGKENQPKNKFCDGCGTPLCKICPSCGARQDADDVFCGECGAKLD